MIKRTKTLALAMILMAGMSSVEAARNVLFIAVDDLKPLVGAYGYDMHTPEMDALAGKGTTFLNAHCQQAVCGPSRASLLTGMRPDYTRIWDLKTKIRKVRPDIVTLPQHFREQGYATAGMGKIFDPRSVDKKGDDPSWSIPFKQGWQLKHDPEYPGQTGHYQGERIHELGQQAKEQGIDGWFPVNQFLFKNDGWPAVESADVSDSAYDDGAIADRGVELIHELSGKDKPFFIAVGFKRPHLPFAAPKKYWDLYDREQIQLEPYQKKPKGSPSYASHTFPELRSYSGIPSSGPIEPELQKTLIHGYFACVSFIDALVGKLMTALEESGAAEDTVIVLWGDHGWHLGDHGLWCKHTNYEQATRVPLIFAGPGVVSGQRNTAPAEFVDLFPTLCELAEIPSAENLAGTSLVPVLAGKVDSVKSYAMSQYPRNGKMGYALRTDQFRYVAWYTADGGEIPDGSEKPLSEELFDYACDPAEKKNLVKERVYADETKRLRGEMIQFLKTQQL